LVKPICGTEIKLISFVSSKQHFVQFLKSVQMLIGCAFAIMHLI